MPISGKPEIGAGVSKDEETFARCSYDCISLYFFPPHFCDAIKNRDSEASAA